MKRVSVIILNWNGLHLLERCLPSVVGSTYPDLEIILADNASTDGGPDWVATVYPSINIVRHPENWGFCRGNNEAVRHATGDYIVFLNNDVEVTPDWLQPLAERMDGDEKVGAVQPKLLDRETRSLFEYAGGSGGFLDGLGYPFTRGRIFFTLEEDVGQYDDPARIFWATGAAIMMRRSALEVVGLLDVEFEFHMEEIDLCWRLARAGYEIRVEPASQVYHVGGASLPRGSTRKTYYNFRNSLLMLYKNIPRRHRLRVFTLRLATDFAALVRMLATGYFGDAAAVLRAYRDYLRMAPRYRSTRPARGELGVLPPYRGSIVLDYFLLGRRHFSDLPARRFRLRDDRAGAE
ncbi:MAG TPA: glycosyltransferase family 2 protein [Rhodothermia bacterium]|nr:glycosyltransferase family 2 protein [Rhodothermia bacterium]